MKTVKPLRVAALSRTFTHQRRHVFVVSPMVCFTLGTDPSLVTEVDLWKALAPRLGAGAALDESMPKATGEVLVSGSAFSPTGEPTAAMRVRLAMGAIDKTLRVTGDRYWLQDGTVSKPLGFVEMPLTWAQAYGGQGFAQNPLGKGFVPVTTSGGTLRPLPNLEDERRLITAPEQRETPVSFGGYDFAWPQRQSKLGTYDGRWLKEQFPGLASDLDWAAFNVSAPEQRREGFWEGDERYTLEGMHPTRATLTGTLPSVVARAFATQKTAEGEKFVEIALRLDTVHFFPDAEKGVMIFRGLLAVAEDDASDLVHLVLGCDDRDDRRPASHYEAVLARRLDRLYGAIDGLNDRDLMPRSMAAARFSGTDEMNETAALLRQENLLAKGLVRRTETERARAEAEAARLGIVLPPHPPASTASLDPPDDPYDTSGLAQLASSSDDTFAQAQAQSDAAVEAAMRSFREHCASLGMDANQLLASRADDGGGPPTFTAEGQLRAMQAHPGFSPTRALVGSLHQTEAQLRDLYRMLAHEQPAARRTEAERSAERRAWVEAQHRAGRSLARADLTGVDLSGIDLTGADLCEAWLEGARLERATLAYADLRDAVLARADLTDATLLGARLPRANLGDATLVRTNFTEADLTEAVLVRAEAFRADFTRATLTKADLRSFVAEETVFHELTAPAAMWIQATLRGGSFTGAELTKGLFYECDLEASRFASADLEGTVWMQCKGDGCHFREARMKNFRAVHGTSLARCDFSDALLDQANFRDIALAGSIFHRCPMQGVDFSGADLTGASLYRATAREGRFYRANLTDLHAVSLQAIYGLFTHATLQGADFTGANLVRADLLGVKGRPKHLDHALLTEVRHVAQREA